MLLAVLAIVFHPRSVPYPNPERTWLAVHSDRVGALITDMTAVQTSPSQATVARLHDDVAAARRLPPPPAASARQEWNLALVDSEAAAGLLLAPKVTSDARARAADALAAASDALAAVLETSSAPGAPGAK